jgi:hypothetical protein
MTQPVTELDARFSDAAAVAADWDQTPKPTKVLAFAKGTFGQTRHRFKRQ